MAKKSGLVRQHLEFVSVDVLDRFQHIIRGYVARRQGVYALYRKGCLYYVGLASDLKWRLGAHLKDRHKEEWDRFSVYFTDYQHLKELESLILRVVRPRPEGNKHSGHFAASENLKRKFLSEIKKHQEDERKGLIGLTPQQSVQVRDNPNSARHNAALKSWITRRRVRRHGRVNSILKEHVQRTGKILRLRATYKGKTYRAYVHKDGTVRYKGREYASPSAAGKAVIQNACNGWVFWHYRRAPRQWVQLSTLRSK